MIFSCYNLLFFVRYKDRVSRMQLSCIHVCVFTQKQGREGREERWHGGYPYREGNRGKYSSS